MERLSAWPEPSRKEGQFKQSLAPKSMFLDLSLQPPRRAGALGWDPGSRQEQKETADSRST